MRINCFEDGGNQRHAKLFGGDIMTKPVTKKQVMRLIGKQIIAVKKMAHRLQESCFVYQEIVLFCNV